jgi:hypothetical protein
MGIVPIAINSVNTVKRMLINPCAVVPEVYIETAFEAVITLIYSFFEPDFREFYHQLRGNSLLCDVKGGLKDTGHVPPEAQSKATRFAFKAAEAFDRSIWYLFLATIINDAVLDWTSLIYKATKCDPAQSPYVGSGPFFFGALHDDGTWSTCDFSAQNTSIYYPVFTSQLAFVPPGKAWTISGKMRFETFEGFPAPTSVRIADLTNNRVLDSYSVTKEQADAGHPTIAFDTGRNGYSYPLYIALQWAFFDGPIPHHEVFGKSDGQCFIFVQP